jgi:hypothetical protein
MEKKYKKISLFKFVLLGFLIGIGTFVLSMTMVRSGIEREYGVGFWGPNGHDGVWHLALQNQVAKKLPPQNPVFSGEKLVNYHYFYDLLVVWVAKILVLPNSFVYFQLMPVVTAFLIGLFSFMVGFGWKKSYWTGFWLTFFNYFAGSLGWIVTLLRSAEIGGESMFWSMQSISTLINPPFALSLLVILAGSLCLVLRKKTILSLILAGLLFGFVVNIKAYGGLVVLTGLFFWAVHGLVKNKDKKMVFVWLGAVFLSTATFLLKNRQSAGLFELNPFWFVNSMIESSGRLYIPKLASARYNLALEGLGLKFILIEAFSLFVFVLGNMGTRVLGLFKATKKIIKNETDDFDWFLLSAMAIGFLLPLFFTQKGTAWNTIQFFYYFLFFANFYLAEFIAGLTKRLKTKWLVLAVFSIIVFTVPTTYSTVRGYFGKNPATYIPMFELEALKFLKSQPDGVVLTFPYNQYDKDKLKPPLPLRFYETTAYVSAYSGKLVYLEDEMNNEITGFDWQKRKKLADDFFKSKDPITARGFLLNNNIDYIYLVANQSYALTEEQLGLEVIFAGQQAKIVKVRR